jgi:hypothetical protein
MKKATRPLSPTPTCTWTTIKMVARLEHLHDVPWPHSSRDGNPHPPSHAQTIVFGNELFALVRRTCAPLRPPHDVNPSPNGSLTALPDLMRRILQAFRIRHERLATPIDRHPEILHYWTPDVKESCLGPITTRSHRRSRTVPSATQTIYGRSIPGT